LICQYIDINKIASLFVLIKTEGIDFNLSKEALIAFCFKDRISAEDDETQILDGFTQLKTAGIEYSTSQPLYDALLRDSNQAQELATRFIQLKTASIDYSENQPLYHALMASTCYAHTLTEGFITLKNAGFDYSENQALYDALIKHPPFAG
jgi:hypothetical protein